MLMSCTCSANICVIITWMDDDDSVPHVYINVWLHLQKQAHWSEKSKQEHTSSVVEKTHRNFNFMSEVVQVANTLINIPLVVVRIVFEEFISPVHFGFRFQPVDVTVSYSNVIKHCSGHKLWDALDSMWRSEDILQRVFYCKTNKCSVWLLWFLSSPLNSAVSLKQRMKMHFRIWPSVAPSARWRCDYYLLIYSWAGRFADIHQPNSAAPVQVNQKVSSVLF